MAIVSRIVLKDEYSSQAKKIISSAESLNKAFGKSQSESKKLDSSLSKAFGKTHKVKITDSESRKVITNINKLDGDLKRVTNKKHSVKVGVEGGNAVTRTIDGIKGKLSSLGSGSLMKSIIGGNLIAGGIQKVAGAVTGAFSSTMSAGFSRLTNIEASQARLRGFGYNQKEVKAISGSAMEAVSGTQYSMADAMTASASAIAAGLKQSELTGYLKDVGNAAAATGSDFNEVASIMNKVKTTGNLQADEMRQLSDRGLPILSTLAEQAGVSVGEMSKRISKGQVGFDEFRSAVKKASGTASEEVAKTWGGAKDNFKSALGKLGAGLLGGNETKDGSQGGLFGMMTPALLKINSAINSLVPAFKNAGDGIKNFVSFGVEMAKKAQELLTPIFEKLGTYITPIVVKLGSYIAPIINTISEGLQNLQPIISDLIETTLPYLQAGIGLISDVFQNILMPIIKTVASIVQEVLGKAFELLGTTIQTVIIPATKALTDFINNVLRPILEEGASVLQDFVLPIIEKVADYISSAVYSVLEGAVSVTGKVVDVFKNVVDAVEDAIDALKGIGDKISGVFGGIKEKVSGWFSGGEANANGTSYYGGGVTKINERGEELIDLPRGSRIYPQGKTDELIKKDISSKSNSSSKVVYYQPRITISGSNMDKKELMYELDKRLKRMAVNV